MMPSWPATACSLPATPRRCASPPAFGSKASTSPWPAACTPARPPSRRCAAAMSRPPGSPGTHAGSSRTFVLRDHRKLRRLPRSCCPIGCSTGIRTSSPTSPSGCSASTTRRPSQGFAHRQGGTQTGRHHGARPRHATPGRIQELRMTDGANGRRSRSRIGWRRVGSTSHDAHIVVDGTCARIAAPATASSPAPPTCSSRRPTAASFQLRTVLRVRHLLPGLQP